MPESGKNPGGAVKISNYMPEIPIKSSPNMIWLMDQIYIGK